MGIGFRAFVASLLAFAVFGVALAAWDGGGAAPAESVAAGSGDDGPGEPLANATGNGGGDANDSGNVTS